MEMRPSFVMNLQRRSQSANPRKGPSCCPSSTEPPGLLTPKRSQLQMLSVESAAERDRQRAGVLHGAVTLQACHAQLLSTKLGGATHTWCLLVMFSTCAGVRPVKLNMPICAPAHSRRHQQLNLSRRTIRGRLGRPGKCASDATESIASRRPGHHYFTLEPRVTQCSKVQQQQRHLVDDEVPVLVGVDAAQVVVQLLAHRLQGCRLKGFSSEIQAAACRRGASTRTRIGGHTQERQHSDQMAVICARTRLWPAVHQQGDTAEGTHRELTKRKPGVLAGTLRPPAMPPCATHEEGVKTRKPRKRIALSTTLMRPAMPSISARHSLNTASSPTTSATMRAPCTGGLLRQQEAGSAQQ
jgi:hypothetical protein